MRRVLSLIPIEVRKVVDTRAGRGLIALSVVVMAILSVAIAWTQPGSVVSVTETKMAALAMANVIAPLIAIMIFTGEWTTRSAMQTFVLEPRRAKVIAAKFGAAMTLAIGTVLVGAVSSVIASAIVAVSAGSGVSFQGFWFSGNGVLSDLARVALYTVLGAGIGALVTSTAVAVTTFIAGTLLVDSVTRFASSQAHQWISLDPAILAISSLDFAARTPLQALAGIAFWLLIPAVAGFYAYRLREVK